MLWYTKAGDINTNIKVKIDLPYLNLAQRNVLRGIIMWMNLLREDMTQS